jgi:hypothetical protein
MVKSPREIHISFVVIGETTNSSFQITLTNKSSVKELFQLCKQSCSNLEKRDHFIMLSDSCGWIQVVNDADLDMVRTSDKLIGMILYNTENDNTVNLYEILNKYYPGSLNSMEKAILIDINKDLKKNKKRNTNNNKHLCAII